MRELLSVIQHELFNLGGELSIPGYELLKSDAVTRLDAALAHYNADLPRLKEFILPAGTRSAAIAHVGRTVARRAERAVVALAATETVRAEPRQFLNRLSDLLFVLARVLNRANLDGLGGDDVYWKSERLARDAAADDADAAGALGADHQVALGQPVHRVARARAGQAQLGVAPIVLAEASVEKVAGVAGIAGDEQLRGHFAEGRMAQLDVDVRRAAGVGHRPDGAEAVAAAASLRVAAEALEAGVDALAGAARMAVAAVDVALPDLDLGAVDRAAGAVLTMPCRSRSSPRARGRGCPSGARPRHRRQVGVPVERARAVGQRRVERPVGHRRQAARQREARESHRAAAPTTGGQHEAATAGQGHRSIGAAIDYPVKSRRYSSGGTAAGARQAGTTAGVVPCAARRAATASLSASSTRTESSQPMQASVMLWP